MCEIDNIKIMYEQISDKKTFQKIVADEFGLKLATVRTGWFSRFEITDKYNVQEKLIMFMQKYIANQNNVAV